jgi:hypothetical protein
VQTGFCRFPQRHFWCDLLDHLKKFPGVGVKDSVDDPVIGSWIDFTYRGYSFTINAKSGEFIFFAEDTACPDSVLAQIAAHFQPFFSGDGEISQRRV